MTINDTSKIKKQTHSATSYLNIIFPIPHLYSCQYTFSAPVFSVCWRLRASGEEPKSTLRSCFTAHVRIIWNMLHPHGPTWWRKMMETDLKLRVAVPECQKLDEGDLVGLDAAIWGKFIVTKLIFALLILVCLSWWAYLHALVGTFTMNKLSPSDFSDSSLPLNNLRPATRCISVESRAGQTLFWLRDQLWISWYMQVPRLTQWWTPVILGLMGLEIGRLAPKWFFLITTTDS